MWLDVWWLAWLFYWSRRFRSINASRRRAVRSTVSIPIAVGWASQIRAEYGVSKLSAFPSYHQ